MNGPTDNQKTAAEMVRSRWKEFCNAMDAAEAVGLEVVVLDSVGTMCKARRLHIAVPATKL